MRSHPQSGFTLIELMVTIAIIGVLTGIAVAKYENTVRKTQEAASKANLGVIRSALSIYSGDHEGAYPTDDLTSLTQNRHYMAEIPPLHSSTLHADTKLVITETSVSDSGMWSYNNADTTDEWGGIHVGCTHQDSTDRVWSTF